VETEREGDPAARELPLQFGGDMDIVSFQGHGKQSAAGVPALHGGGTAARGGGGRPSGPHDAHYVPLDDAKLDKYKDTRLKRSKLQEGNMPVHGPMFATT
jgi:hypothetical protein